MSLESNYEFAEYQKGDWLVVEDLAESDSFYSKELLDDGFVYEARMSGHILGRFCDWEGVESFLENRKV